MVASTPPSFVKFASRLASVRIGARVSTPTRDHVPDEMYANAGRSAGTATTADAVSCDPTSVTTVVSCSPVASRTAGSTPPRTVPGSASGGNSGGVETQQPDKLLVPMRVRGSSRPVVDACVRSAITTPVSQ